MKTTVLDKPKCDVPRYVIIVSQAKMPSSCDGSGSYYRIGLLETDGTQQPKRIDERSRGCVRIVATWERLFRGKTDRCAFARAMKEAESMRDSLL